jgi:hypothetical protein
MFASLEIVTLLHIKVVNLSSRIGGKKRYANSEEGCSRSVICDILFCDSYVLLRHKQ